MLQPGDSLRVRGERWHVVTATTYDACVVVELAGAEASNGGRTSRFILPFEPIDRLPAVVERPRLVRPSTWRRIARRALADATPTWHSLRAAARAQLSLLPFQLEPALAMTQGLACRFLLADEVGLGKTVQAGLMVAELLAREPEARVLGVTPAGLREQWRDELRDRFRVDAAVVDAAALARASADLPLSINPWGIPRVVITSIDFLKRSDVVRSLESLTWDLAIFDEAHALAGRSDRATAANVIAERSRRVVLISATPHNGDEAAYQRLREIGQLGPSDRVMTFRRSRAEAGVPRIRRLKQLLVTPTRAELRMHRALEVYAARVSREAPADTSAAARLAMIVLARRASSSASSLARSIERRIAMLASSGQPREGQLLLPLDEELVAADEEPIHELAARGMTDADAEERRLRQILVLARAVGSESKVAAVRRLLARTREPAIVFTEYRDTLARLAATLQGGAALLHGGLTSRERASEARRFTHGSARLLLATDAASEGLNLHQRCRLVVSLDLPWTPLRLEQRIGRVDRLGQSRRVHALTLVARGTSEMSVASALAARGVRADRGAPFRASEPDVTPLAADAQSEASRLALSRALGRAAGEQRTRHRRPPIATFTRKDRPPVWLALRLLFVDSNGAWVWDTLTALRAPAGRFDALVREHGVALAAAAASVHAARAARLRSELHRAVDPLVARERAILARLAVRDGRLASALVQPGLFDRRALREAEAQRRIAADLALRAEAHIAELERRRDVAAGGRCLVFAVAR